MGKQSVVQLGSPMRILHTTITLFFVSNNFENKTIDNKREWTGKRRGFNSRKCYSSSQNLRRHSDNGSIVHDPNANSLGQRTNKFQETNNTNEVLHHYRRSRTESILGTDVYNISRSSMENDLKVIIETYPRRVKDML